LGFTVAFSTADVVETDVAESVATEGAEPEDAVTEPEEMPDEPELVDAAGQPSASSASYVDVALDSVASSLPTWVSAVAN
jgi:hypothetical protein